MRVVQVLTRGDVVGGAQTHVHDLCIALRLAGHEVTVITGPRGIFNRRLEDSGIAQLSIPHLVRPVRPWQDLRALAALVQAFRRLRPELVCAHTAKAGWLARTAARMLGIPSTFTPHGWSIVDRGSLRVKQLFLFAERLAGAMGGRIVNVCRYERELAAGFRVARPELLEVVHNGVADLPAERTESVAAEPPRIVMVARYEPQKDHDTLLHALAGLKDLPWTLTLVGEGDQEPAVQMRIDELGLRARCELLPGNADVAEVLLTSQIFALTTRFEAFPISILEAMRAAMPVIATDVGGIAEAVSEGETGLLVHAGDVRALREALRRLIQDPALRTALGTRGRARFREHFTAEKMAARTLDVYARARARAATQKPAMETA